MSEKPILSFLGWNERQWAYVQWKTNSIESFSELMQAKFNWDKNSRFDPPEIGSNQRLTALIMSHDGCHIYDYNSDSNIDALDAAHKKAIAPEPKPVVCHQDNAVALMTLAAVCALA